MKKFFEKIAILATSAVVIAMTFSACSKDDGISEGYAVDYYPVYFEVYVEDAAGNNLVDPEYEGNILDDVKLICNGEEYPLSDEYSWARTRTYLPHFYGVINILEGYGMPDRYGNRSETHILQVGEFDGEPGHEGEATLCLGDNITIDLAYESKKGKLGEHKIPESVRRYWVNGVEQETTTVKIIL